MTISDDCVAGSIPDNSHLIVAFASHEGDIVDQHFGSALAFYAYDIHPKKADFIAHKIFGREARDGNEDKLKPKLSWLVGCDVVYCGSIGGSATRQLISLGITPVKVEGGPELLELIADLQSQLLGAPEFWLANVLKQKRKKVAGTVRFATEEDWS